MFPLKIMSVSPSASTISSPASSFLSPSPTTLSRMSTNAAHGGLIGALNECLFNSANTNINFCNFPLIITVAHNDDNFAQLVETIEEVGNLTHTVRSNPTKHVQVSLLNCKRSAVDALVYRLHELNYDFSFDYSKFISHPGILFIKNLSSELVFDNAVDSTVTITHEEYSPDSLFDFLQKESYFKSLKEVKLFRNENSSSAFAIVKFDNYLDVDVLIEKLHKSTPNAFNTNSTIPLFFNRYLNKRERYTAPPSNGAPLASSSPTSTSAIYTTSGDHKLAENFDTITIENLQAFFPKDLTSLDFYQFVGKFKEFGNDIESIYFPIVGTSSRSHQPVELQENSPTPLKCLDYGYVQFKSSQNLMENTLRILYYLNNLTWDEFNELDTAALKPLLSSDDRPEDNGQLDTNAVKVTIAQHKHNHYLYNNANNFYLSWSAENNVAISYPNPVLIINQYTKQNNFQETNIYVNNLPVVFNNDDTLWELFWEQFGKIKSAKIIKPEYYSIDNEGKSCKSGRIGFVFYESFQMATRAILLTNNKLVNMNGTSHPILILSSFAIQKSHGKSPSYPAQIPIMPSHSPISLHNISIPQSIPIPPEGRGSHKHVVPVYAPYVMVPQVPYYNPYYYAPQVAALYPHSAYSSYPSGNINSNSNRRKERSRSNEHSGESYYSYEHRTYQGYRYEDSYDGKNH